jgi:two-component system, cell cycle response regulator
MTARVLVVDDILANVKLLEARLAAEYFEVVTAHSGQQAVDICAHDRIDVVLLDVMMPGMDGFEACRLIKALPQSHHVPVIMVTALDQPSDKIQGLSVGADDFLTKPVDDIALITRVKNLARLKMLNDEMLMRASTSQQMGLSTSAALEKVLSQTEGRVLVVDDHIRTAQRLIDALGKVYITDGEVDTKLAMQRINEEAYDVVLISLNLAQADGLRLCSQLRSLEATRHLPIIIMVEPGEDARLMRGLDMGVNDYLVRPIDRNEMLARVRTQLKRKRFTDYLRVRLEETVEQAVTDALTGLHNRRYMENHLKTLLEDAQRTGRPLSVLVADIDFFKRVNDTYGHDGGDLVLKEFATRFRRNTRAMDLTCRLGGEEFVIVMPDTDINRAFQVGERLRAYVAAEAFQLNPTTRLRVTTSVGISAIQGPNDTAETLFKRADQALYAAKRDGRNRVVLGVETGASDSGALAHA